MIFIIVSFVLRFVQGIGCALTSTLIYSIAASNSDEESMKANIGYMELAYSVGLTIGPLVASFFYHFFGIGFPFFVCGLIMIGGFYFLRYLVIEEVKLEDSPNFFHVLTNFNILLTFIAVIMDMLSTTFVYPVFATHLLDTFGLSVEKASFFFIIEMFTYFMTLQFLDRVSRILGSKLTMSVGMILNFIFVMFLCPVSILPQSLFMVVFGLVGIGIAGALITIPAIVDLMESIRDFLNIEEDLAKDYASGLYNLGVNLAESIGPIIGGYLTGKRNFNFACYTISFSNLIYFCLYTSCNFSLIKEQLNEPDEDEDEDSKQTAERQKSTVLIGRRARFSRQFSIHSRYSFPNKIGRSRSLTKSITRLSGLMEMQS